MSFWLSAVGIHKRKKLLAIGCQRSAIGGIKKSNPPWGLIIS